jgi:hypothetical protein
LAGSCTVELDDVHGRHGKAGAVDHAADITVERHIGEIVFGRFDFLGVFFGLIAQCHDVVVAEQRVAVEGHLGIEHPQVAVLHDDQRVDLQQRHVFFDKRLVKDREQL